MTISEMLGAAEHLTPEQAAQVVRDAGACRESRRVSRDANRCDCFCCVYDRDHAGARSTSARHTCHIPGNDPSACRACREVTR